jgi:hypothetical protein
MVSRVASLVVTGILLISLGAVVLTGVSNVSARPLANASGDPVITSYNWAGYTATGTPGSVALVNGSWTEPSIACTTTHPATLASIWVGIDGYPAASSTVEAMGTTARCLSGHAVHLAWYELYPSPPVVFMPVSAGDKIHVQVIHPTAGILVFVFQDVTNSSAYSTTQLVSSTTLLGSAECIVQRVLSPGLEYASPARASGPAPPFVAFSSFGVAAFSYCVAKIGNSAGGIATLPPASVYYVIATYVAPTVFAVTLPAAGPNSAFKVIWTHF